MSGYKTRLAQIALVLVSMNVSANDIPPLQVHLDLNFEGMMDNQVTLEYQYFYNDFRTPPFKGQQVFSNNNLDQTTELLRDSNVDHIVLFLRPSGAGSVECVPSGGQNPSIFNNVQSVEVVGLNVGGTYRCQLVITG